MAMGAFLLSAVLLACYLAFSSALDLRTWRMLRREYRTEQTRAEFATARRLLVTLAAEQKLDSRSQTFLHLYRLQTFALRRPDEYKLIADLFVQLILKPAEAGAQQEDGGWLAEEIRAWPAGMADVLKHMVAGLGRLVGFHAGIAHLLRLGMWASRHASNHVLRVTGSWAVRGIRSMVPAAAATERLLRSEAQLIELRVTAEEPRRRRTIAYATT